MRSLSLLVVLVGALVSGCIGSKTTRCSWGEICPSDRYCEPALGMCLYPAQADVCQGVPDSTPLTACTFTDAPSGAFACLGGFCLVSVCGDGNRGPGEACDDGNVEDQDGCASDCQSDESCRNGVWDPLVGEGCDDGNAVSHDGCSSGCTSENVYFDLLSANISERFGAAADYDPVRQVLVVFSGFTPDPYVLTDTWEYDGHLWREVEVNPSPEGRQDHSLTYVPSLGGVVAYAGWNGYETLSDLWSFDGNDWLQLQTATVPPARTSHGAAYDAGRDRLVIFGGEAAGRAPFGDHWEYDGSDWIRMTSDATPPPRRYPSLAYDELRGRLVLFGGSYGDNPWEYLNDTWEFDGSNWIEMSPALSPTGRHGSKLRWDPVGQRLILYGGMIDYTPLGSSWVYDAGEWSPLPTTTDPPARGQFLMAPDPLEPGLVVRGGHEGGYVYICHDDAWALVGDQWVTSEGYVPRARIEPAMAYDPGLGSTVLFGGLKAYGSGVYREDTWMHTDGTWKQVTTGSAPQGRAYTPLAYDGNLGQVVLYGGCSGSQCGTLHSDMWAFDGTQWTLLSVDGNAGPRAQHGLAYDQRSEELVMFGGAGGLTGHLETCRFDGNAWSCVLLNPSPPPRLQPALAYDVVRMEVVLFGGWDFDNDVFLNDTWVLDADGWHERTPTPSPPGRSYHQMIYHATRQRVQLFGGHSGVTGTLPLADLWEFNGFGWSLAAMAADAPHRMSFGLAYDSRERQVVFFGGQRSDFETYNETWLYYYDSTWPDEQCDTTVDEDGDGLVGCDDPDCPGRLCGGGRTCTNTETGTGTGVCQ